MYSILSHPVTNLKMIEVS